MTENRHGAIWVRANDLERLFSARRICYLVGSYDGSEDYGDILQLHANVMRLESVGEDILAAPTVSWKCSSDHDALCNKHPWLFNDSCFLYYVPEHELNDAEPTLNNQQLVSVPAPPTALSHIVAYGAGFINSCWDQGGQGLNLIDSLANWLEDVSSHSHPFAIVGQQISDDFLTNRHAEQVAAMLDQASMLGVRDELSLENLKQWSESENVSDAIVSGDDTALPIITGRDNQRQWAQTDPQIARTPAGPPVVNIHLNAAKYVTDHAYKLQEAFEAIVRGLRRDVGDALTLNFLIAYDDSRNSESRIVDQLRESPTVNNCSINVVSCIDELHQGFPNIGRAQLTVSCSYHVALTSLLLGIPTAFVVGNNEHYSQKAEGLKRTFHLPDTMLFDIQHDSTDSFSAALKLALCDQSHRARLREGAAQGAASMLLRSTAASTALSKFLTARYVASQEERYQATAARLLDTTEQLSDLRLEYSRLLNSATKLSAAHRATLQSGQSAATDYEQTVRAVRSVVRKELPTGAKVLVVSKGDRELLKLDGGIGWHFPQTPGRVYAGHYPVDSAAAIKHLEDLRSQGAGHIVFPSTAFWWLDYYGELAKHLNTHYQKTWSDQNCIIYQLSSTGAKPATTQAATGQQRAGTKPAAAEAATGQQQTGTKPAAGKVATGQQQQQQSSTKPAAGKAATGQQQPSTKPAAGNAAPRQQQQAGTKPAAGKAATGQQQAGTKPAAGKVATGQQQQQQSSTKPAAGKAATGQQQQSGAKPVATSNGARDVKQEPDPIIVYGSPRSGTTYLMQILNRHPAVNISKETRLFVWVHRTLNVETHEYHSVFKDRERFIAYLRGRYPDLIRNYYRELDPDARYWGDKNPHYLSPDNAACLQTIRDLFPGARFINIIRDGRGTVASVLRKEWEDFETAHQWATVYHDFGLAFGRSLPPEQYFELRYEDLIQDDTAMARQLFDFLGIEIHPDVVKFCDQQRVKRTPVNNPERDLSGDLTQSDWSSILTPEQQLRSLELLGEYLVRFGYETEASLAQLHNDLRRAATPSLAGSVRDVIRGALTVGSNGSGRRFGISKRGTD